MDPITLIGGGLNLLGSLFGRKKSPTPAQNIVSQAKGAREAAAMYGFNPLTMLQYGQPGGSMAQGDVAPLASLSILGDMLTDNFGPDAKDRREHNQLNNDLLRLQLDQARGLVRQPSDPSAVAGLTDRAPSLGRSATSTVATVGGRGDPRTFGIPTNARDWLTPGRKTVVTDNKIGTGLIHTNNALTGPVSMLTADGDEPLMEYIQTPLAYGMQVPYNWAGMAKDAINTVLTGKSDLPPSKSLAASIYDTVSKAAKRRKKRRSDNDRGPSRAFHTSQMGNN